MSDRVAVVTGAACNIGKGIARSFLEAGYSCILLDRDKSELEKTVFELEKSYQNCSGYVVDVSDLDQITNFVGMLDRESIQVGTLVNNVGYEPKESLLELDSGSLRTTLLTNLEGPYLLTSLLAQRMARDQFPGNIVFISSVHGKVTRTHPFYSSSKAAIEMFVKEAALELAPHNVRVNAIAPGPVEDTQIPNKNPYVPYGFSFQPIDVGEVTTFLISEKARFITGQTITVDGGYSIAHTHHWIKRKQL